MSDSRPPKPPNASRAGSTGPLSAAELIRRLRQERTVAGSPAVEQARPDATAGPTPRRLGRTIAGRLEAHGRANYGFQADTTPSYYVKILTSSGPKTLWGVDLERALLAGATQPKLGDQIGARRVGREVVTLGDRARAADGRAHPERRVYRARWEVEKIGFLVERAQRARLVRDAQLDARAASRSHPELRSAFLSLRAAEEVAARRIKDPRDRERFLSLLREAISESVRRGEPLPDVRLRKQSATARDEALTAPRTERERDEPTR